ncbi:unnamed protein product [Auanema sp. JU1783]|nr:unnamed protein product [Auanema sp. JU1783]
MRNAPVTSTPKRDNVWSLYRTASDRYHDLEPIVTLDPTGALLDHNTKNNNSLPSTDVGTLNYLLKYQQAQRDNNILLISLRDREREIQKLKSIIKSLQSESESTDSRQDKSTSLSSGLPVVRVTPQKRVKNNTSASSPRRSSRRSLFEPSTSQVNVTEPLSYSRQILRNAGIESDVLLSSSNNSTPRHLSLSQNLESITPIRATHNTTRASPPEVHNRHRPVPPNNANRFSPNDTFVVEKLGHIPGNPPPTARDEPNRPPSYYLTVNRPAFIRRSELRQSIIKEASRRREQIEKKRKEAVRALAMGVVSLDDVSDKIFVDSTKIQAFPKTDMKAITQRRMSNTREYKDRVIEREKKIEQAANRILKTCFSWKTRNRLSN